MNPNPGSWASCPSAWPSLCNLKMYVTSEENIELEHRLGEITVAFGLQINEDWDALEVTVSGETEMQVSRLS